MFRTHLKALLLIPLAVLLMGSAVLMEPQPIPVPAGLTAKDVSKAIRMGIVQRGWVVLKDENGRVDAVLNLRSHETRIAIAYDTSQVKVTYVSSQNLDYEEKKGVRRIHKNYNKWIQNVVSDISRQLQSEAIARE